MGKYVHCLILNRDSEIPDRFWDLTREDACLGVNEGWYIGPDAIRGYYTAWHERHKRIAEVLRARFPNELGSLTETEIFGIGTFRVSPLACPVIEAAADGRSATGLWYSQGAYADVSEAGPVAHWTWGYYAADFVQTTRGWRISALSVLNDIDTICGQDPIKAPVPYPDLREFESLRAWTPPAPTRREMLREYYHPLRPITGSPKIPQADVGCANPTSESDEAPDAETAAIKRVWDVEEIKKLMHRRVYYQGAGRIEDELRDFWVNGESARATASFGCNAGYYVGMETIEDCYLRKNKLLSDGVGRFVAHPVSTGLVRLAADGKTGRGMWYSISFEVRIADDGKPYAKWLLEKIAVDFLREADGWKIWRIVESADLTCAPGEDYSEQPIHTDPAGDFVSFGFGTPTIPFITHDTKFNWWDDYPAMPRPYASYSDKDGYGPAGHPKSRLMRPPQAEAMRVAFANGGKEHVEAFADPEFISRSRRPELAQRIRNAASSQEVENIKAVHSYLHARADATGEWSTIWSKSDECSWAHAFGRMRGFDRVWFGSVTCYDAMAFENWLAMYKNFPEIGGKDPRPLMEASVHTLVTDVIEVAANGRSARAAYITPGVIHSVLTPSGRKYCNVLWERYGSDFVLEDGEWKYLHEQVCPDILTRLDNENWAALSYRMLVSAKEALPPTLGDPPPVSDPGPLHRPYTPITPPQDTCPWPEPYETLDANNTYTPPRSP